MVAWTLLETGAYRRLWHSSVLEVREKCRA